MIFSSSGSVYGVSKEKKVTEKTILKPISIYNKTKMIAERIFKLIKKFKYNYNKTWYVCGVSKRLRLDVSVNMLTIRHGKIT